MAGLHELVQQRVGRGTALVADGEPLTYGQWQDAGDTLAAGLLDVGVEPGDRVALVLPNSALWVVAAYATSRIGAVVVPVSTWSQPRELLEVLRHCGAAVAVAVPGLAGNKFRPALKDAVADPQIPLQRVMFSDAAPGEVRVDGLVGSSAARGRLDELSSTVRPRDAAAILYTSGTTGRPKGVVHCHDALSRNGWNIGESIGLVASDRVLTTFPFFFSAGFCNAVMSTLTHVATLVTHARFDPEVTHRDMLAWDCDVRIAWGSLVNRFRDLDGFDEARYRLMRGLLPLLGVAEQHADVIDRSMNMYGNTEAAAVFTSTRHDDPDDVRLGTYGRPFDDNELRIVDIDTGRPVASGQGEILIKGNNLMLGYHGMPYEAAFDEEGFFHTGDAGEFDPSGNLLFKGRLRGMVKRAGFSVYPEEVELVLAEDRRVAQACVVSVGEGDELQLAALVVSAHPDPAGLTEHLRSRLVAELSSYKRPDAVFVLPPDGLPSTSSGKVMPSAATELARRLLAGTPA